MGGVTEFNRLLSRLLEYFDFIGHNVQKFFFFFTFVIELTIQILNFSTKIQFFWLRLWPIIRHERVQTFFLRNRNSTFTPKRKYILNLLRFSLWTHRYKLSLKNMFIPVQIINFYFVKKVGTLSCLPIKHEAYMSNLS